MAKRPRPPRRDPVFTEFRRAKLLRKRIPLAEVGSGLAVLLFLALTGGWVRAQRDAFDPAERDVDMAWLGTGEVSQDLHVAPVQRWRDPALGPPSGAAVELGPFPASLLSGGWTAGRVQHYTAENLYEKINGQAEQYLKFDFRALDVLPLRHEAGGASIDLYLYDQGSFPNALGLYAEQRGEKPTGRRGSVHFTRTSVGAYGLSGGRVFHVIGTPEGEALTAKTDEILAALDSGAVAASTPVAFRVLHEGLGIPLGRIGYTPVNAFSLGFAERFWFGSPAAGSTARVFVHEAGSAADAEALASRLAAAQEAELESVSTEGGRLVARHRFLATWTAIGSEGRAVYGVEDHPEQVGAEALADRLRSALGAVRFGPAPAVTQLAPAAAEEAEPAGAPEAYEEGS